ncbi:MAG TPA: hypothetical protein VM580_20620 [Labilithrix sp.]|nr:hypothetical protein [Labilithrix sp.]
MRREAAQAELDRLTEAFVVALGRGERERKVGDPVEKAHCRDWRITGTFREYSPEPARLVAPHDVRRHLTPLGLSAAMATPPAPGSGYGLGPPRGGRACRRRA